MLLLVVVGVLALTCSGNLLALCSSNLHFYFKFFNEGVLIFEIALLPTRFTFH